jgi:capsular polysaccharide biosynthesis protein
VNDRDRTITWSRGGDLLSRLWTETDDIPVDEERPEADLSPGRLVNLGFFAAVLRRRARVWCLTAVLGLVIGSGLYLKSPPPYHATATVLVTYNNPAANPGDEVPTEQSVAGSRVVAGRVVQQLGLQQSVASFQAAYTVTIVTDNVLMFNVAAPSSAAAVQRVSALAATYLQYRAQYAQTQDRQLFAQLDQQSNAAQRSLKTLNEEINQLPTVGATPAQRAEYASLQTQIGQQEQIIQYVTTAKSAAITNTNNLVTGSYVLDAATALPRSKVKGPALYFVGGLFGGLVIGMGSVIVAALMSRRPRRRDDVAVAMGAPVRLSIGPLRRRRWSVRPRKAKRNSDMRRVVAYLRQVALRTSRSPASLAVVAVDDAQVAARVVASLAVSCAAEGMHVVVADLSSEAHLAHLLGVRDPGIHPVRQNGSNLTAILPGREEVAPVGPVPGSASLAAPAQADTALVTACSSADLLLTLVTLDPAFGGDHLGTWATLAVAAVTAGKSSAEKIRGVGDMIRLAGTRLDSAVLVGADKRDDSLGVIDQAEQSEQSAVMN